MNMSLGKVKIKGWLWVFYPILTGVFMVISLNFLMGPGPAGILTVFSKQSENTQEEQTLAQMKIKLEALKGVDKDIETSQLKSLLVAVPQAKKIWFLLEAINKSASDAGMIINQFGGTAGDVKEASDSATFSAQITNPDSTHVMSLKVDYEVATFDSLYNVIKEIENYLPLVKVTKVTFTGDKATVLVEGAWGQFLKPLKNVSIPLPTFQENVIKALNDIRGMYDLTAEGN